MCTVSLCMIVRDEEQVLGRCLNSVAGLADEIIIVDTGSTDATPRIAAAYTDKVYDFPWQDDFAVARNAAFDRATCDFCLWLDADDVLLAADRQELARLKNRLDDTVDVVMLRYNTGFDDQGRPAFGYYRERLVRRAAGFRWQGAVHEVIDTSQARGRVLWSDCAVTHWKLGCPDPQRNLRIFEGLLHRGARLDLRQQFYYARELYYNRRYGEALAVFGRFLAAEGGWLENRLEACRQMAYCWYALGRRDKALGALLQSLAYDRPRAETCCDLGAHFMGEEAWDQAVYWFRQALACPRNDRQGGFVLSDAYGYIPCLQLCVCMSRLGDNEQAAIYNEQAAAYKPDSPAVLHNREYFASIK